MALSFIGDLLSRKVMLPSVMFLIAIGMIFGPLLGSELGLSRASLLEVVPFLAPLTITFIAFDAGAHMNVSDVMQQSRRALILSVLGFLFSSIVIAIFLHYLLSFRWAYALLLSSAWGGVNTATVASVCKHLKVSEKTITTLTISSLIDDIIVLVSALTILNYVSLGNMGFEEISLALMRNVSISFFLGVIVGIAWLNISARAGSGEYTYTFTLAAVLLVYSATEMLEGTGAIAIFLFGLILGNSESFSKSLKLKVNTGQLSRIKNQIVRFHSELTFIIITFFFTFIGLIYVFTGIFDLILGLIVSLLLHATRYIAVKIGTWRSSLAYDLPAIGLIVGKGAASAAMSTLPIAYGLPNTDPFTGIALNVILFTNIISIILPFLARNRSR